jgi:hypothetical protein
VTIVTHAQILRSIFTEIRCEILVVEKIHTAQQSTLLETEHQLKHKQLLRNSRLVSIADRKRALIAIFADETSDSRTSS